MAKKQFYTGAIFSALAIFNLGWVSSESTVSNASCNLQDTIPGSNRSKNYYQGEPKDLDKRIDQLEKGLEKLDQQLQGKEFDKMEQKFQEAISKIDVAAIQQKVDEAMKKVDFKKMQVETAEVIKKINMQKIQQQIQDAMKEAEDKPQMKKLQQELREGMKEVQKSIEEAKKIDYKKLEQELEKSREQWQKQKINIEKELQEAKKEISNNKGNIQKELGKAREQIQNAREELLGYKKMITLMDKEGVLKSNEDYTIDFQEGALLINGKRQTQQVFDSYKSYFKQDNTHIKNQKGNFTVNNDN